MSTRFIQFVMMRIEQAEALIRASNTRKLCLAHDLATSVTIDKFMQRGTFKFLHSKGAIIRMEKLQSLQELQPKINMQVNAIIAHEANLGHKCVDICGDILEKIIPPYINSYFPLEFEDRNDITDLAILFSMIYTLAYCNGLQFKIEPIDYLPSSPNIQNLGVFSRCDLYPETFVDSLIMIQGQGDQKELANLSPNSKSYVQTSRWTNRQMMCVGPAMFINHSCERNVEFTMMTRKAVKVKVLKPIRAGEELVESYDYLVPKDECLCEKCRKK